MGHLLREAERIMAEKQVSMALWLLTLAGLAAIASAGVGGFLGTPAGAPRLLGSSMIEYNNRLYIFGGIPPTNKIYTFDLSTRQWQILTPNGEDRPLGRMFHSAAIKLDTFGQPEAMVIYGGINCFSRVVVTTSEVAVAYYTFSNNAIEYQNAMEDIWFFGFQDQVWIEMKTVRTKRRGDCPQAENVAPIAGSQTVSWRDDKGVNPDAMLRRSGRVIDLSDPRTLDPPEDPLGLEEGQVPGRMAGSVQAPAFQVPQEVHDWRRSQSRRSSKRRTASYSAMLSDAVESLSKW